MNAMPTKVIYPFFFFLLLIGCTKEKTQINVACELSPDGTYLIKWETYPPMTGTVRIYESNRPDSFNINASDFEVNIQDGYKRILAMASYVRPYFKLVFNKNYSVITADRIVPMQGIFNFRDLGGYSNKENHRLKWGKLYRSGSLSMADRQDIRTLNQLGIETVIDLRTEKESYLYPNKFKAPQVYNMPLRGNRHDIFFAEILSQKMKRDDILGYDQSVFSFLLENNTDYFIRMFDVLLDEKKYPVVIFCSLGKDRSAIAAALILAVLDVDDDTILDDYLLSNKWIDYPSLLQNADIYPAEVQETITALFSAHRETLKNSFDALTANYGSVANYLEHELKLTPKKREKLKSILLYE
ncbi:tyrosine phosphatase [Bacteroidia bacterium]|nr:tyrosine phosphatase [Bacteroidia bacterium]